MGGHDRAEHANQLLSDRAVNRVQRCSGDERMRALARTVCVVLSQSAALQDPSFRSVAESQLSQRFIDRLLATTLHRDRPRLVHFGIEIKHSPCRARRAQSSRWFVMRCVLLALLLPLALRLASVLLSSC